MNKKQFIGIVIATSALLLSSCDEGMGPDGNSNGDGDGNGGSQNSGRNQSLSLEFDLDDAVALVANEDLIETDRSLSRAMSRDGRQLFRYRLARESTGTTTDTEEEVGASNLLAVDGSGNASPAITTNFPLKVMYSVSNPDGSKVYLALETGWENYDGNDYTQVIAQSNCALFEVVVATNAYSCAAEGLFVKSMNDEYMKAVSGNQKPIQFDSDGNMYFAATSFTREEDTFQNCFFDESANEDVCEDFTNYWINGWGSWSPIVYRIDTDGVLTNVSQDTESVGFFLVLPSGELVYQSWNTSSGGNSLKMIRSDGTVTPLTDNDTWIAFFAVDSANTVLYGTENWNQNNATGIQMARPIANGLTEFANLDTSLFGSNRQGTGWQSPTPRRVILADDGRLYGVFEGGRDSYNPNTLQWTWTQTLKVFQILPFDAVPKVELDLGSDWWSWMQSTPFQIANGYMYFTDDISVPGFNKADVIKMVNLDTREVTTVLNPIESYSPVTIGSRYTLYNWRLSDEILYFSALKLNNNTVVLGEIDTREIAGASSSADYLTIQETASAAGAASSVQDIEVIAASAPVDDAQAPSVDEVFTDSENMFSISIDFSEPMDHDSVESNLTLTSSDTDEGNNGVVPYLPLWIGSTLHLVPDLQDSETDVAPTDWNAGLALLYPTTIPMTFSQTYTLDGFTTSMTDLFASPLTVPVFSSAENVLTLRPENGWYSSTLAQSPPTAVADADILKFAARFDQYNWKNYTLHADLPVNFRVQFSAINFGWDGVQLAVFDQENADARGTDDWWSDSMIKLRLGNWTEMNYMTQRFWDAGNNHYYGTNNAWLNTETRNVFDGKWKSYRLDVYGNNIVVSVSTDGTTWTTLTGSYDPDDEFNFIDFIGLDLNDDANATTEYHLVLRTVSALAFDNVEITTLTVGGAVATSSGDVMSTLDGSSVPASLLVPATYSFDNW